MVESALKITVCGRIDCPNYQQSVVAANAIAAGNSNVCVEIMQFFETQWEEFLRKTASVKKGVFYDHKESPLVYLNDSEYVGTNEIFQRYALMNYNYLDSSPFDKYVKEA
jgi:hypothetical protein